MIRKERTVVQLAKNNGKALAFDNFLLYDHNVKVVKGVSCEQLKLNYRLT